MIIQFTAITEVQQGPDIGINCPACGASGIAAHCFESTEVGKLFFFIPVVKLRNTWVECAQCGAKLRTTARLADLPGRTPEELAGVIRYRASGKAKVFTAIALLTCLVPGLGIVTSAVSTVMTRGTKGAAVLISGLSMVLAIVVTLCTAILYFDLI